MTPPIFHYDNRPAGAGKTHDQILRIINSHGRYLLAVDRVEIMTERSETLARMSTANGARIHISSIFASSPSRTDGVQSVRVALEALPTTFDSGHVVVICTHQALKEADLTAFAEWHLIIDETPSWWDRTSLRTATSATLIREMFDLEPCEVGSRIVPRRRVSCRDLHLDSLAAPLATLYARASRRTYTVYTHLRSWDELDSNPDWTWWALWSPAALSSFSSVTILAAAFDKSLTLALARRLAAEIDWHPVQSSAVQRLVQPRRLTIRYFAQDHHASRHRFESQAGVEALGKIGRYLAKQPEVKIWTCNERDRFVLDPGMRISGYLRPRQAGTNSYAHISEAAIIYTAKPDPHERAMLSKLSIDPDLVVQTRERDTIYQFVSRTSLRDPASTRPVSIYVYVVNQAMALAATVEDQSAIKCQLELVDLGFAHEAPSRATLSHLSDSARADRRRQQAKERKQRQRTRERAG